MQIIVSCAKCTPSKASVLASFCKSSGIEPMISLPLGRAFKHYTKSASWVIPTGLQECCFATRCRGCPGTSGAPEDAIFDLNGPLWTKAETFGGRSNWYGCSPPVTIRTNRATRRDFLGKKKLLGPPGALRGLLGPGVPKGGPFWFK